MALNPELQRIQQMVCSLLTRVAAWLVLKYLVLDGHFGNNPATQMALRCGLHLVSKLRSDAALYFCYDGEPPKHGKRLYGDKLNYAHLPARYLKQTSIQAGLETRIYQAQMRHKEFAQPLNVVLIIKRNLTTNAEAHVVLFSTDLTLAYDRLIDYYTLRFQIEFNFRDAKQFWGLDDFMNTQPTAVTNAANLALFMTTLSFVLLRPFRRIQPDFSVLDLKAYCRGYKYALETMKLLPQPLDDISISTTAQKIATLGAIHPTQFPFSP